MTRMARISLVFGVLVSIILIGGWTFTASADNLRKIVRFRPITRDTLCLQGHCIDLNTTEGMEKALAEVTKSGSAVVHQIPFVNVVAVELPAATPDKAMAYLKNSLYVLDVVDDQLARINSILTDLTKVDPVCPMPAPPPPLVCLTGVDCYPEGTQEIEADYAHEQFPGVRGSGVKVAIIDTGISWHQEFDNRLMQGYNALPMGNLEGPPLGPVDNHGHGTAMAGTVGANLTTLAAGIVGVAPGVTLVPVKAFDIKGEGYVSDVAYALQWVRNRDIDVVSMSFGFSVNSPVLEDAIKSVYDSGVIMVAAAGNRCAGPITDDGGGDACLGGPPAEDCGENALTTVTYPAAYTNWVLSVGAADFHRQVPYYSLSGPLDVVAPGGEPEFNVPDLIQNGQIISTNKGLIYARGHGTSQAAAHVAGAVALAVQQASDLNKPLSFQGVRSLLRTTATPLVDPLTGKLYPNDRQGAGLINVNKILLKLTK